MLLKFFRKRKNMKRIMWVLAILIIPAFVIWGAGSAGRKKGEGPDYAGRIFGRKISFEEYLDMWQVTRDYAINTFGANLPPEFIDQMTWNRLILLEETKRKKIIAKDSEVVERITSFPVFQREGAFDKKLYKSMLGDSVKAFEEKIRDDISVFKLREKVTSGISVSEEEAKEAYKKKFEKIKASYISIAFSDFENNVRYKASDILDFYEKNKRFFRKPEEINVRYIEISSDSDKDTEDLSYKVLDKAIEKKNLDEVARLFGLETKETGFFSMQQEVPGIGWSYEFTKKGFELEPGDVSNVLIKTDKGFYIIQLKEKKDSYIPEFREVKNSAAEYFIKNMAIKLSEKEAKKLFMKISNRMKSGSSFEDIARSIGLEVKETDFITRDGYIPGLGPATEFVDASSSLETNEISGPIKMLESWIILRQDGYEGIDEAKFLEEKETFKQDLLSRKKQEVFDRWFQNLKKEADFVSYTSK